MTYHRNPAQQYHSQQILNATPAQQVVMLYDGAILNCQKAQEAIAAGDIQARHNANRKAMEIVAYMQEVLDVEKGGDVAKRLSVIYSFLLRRLMAVDFKNDARICDEVINHLRILRASWAQIAQGGATGGQPSGTVVKKPDENPAVPAIRSAVA